MDDDNFHLQVKPLGQPANYDTCHTCTEGKAGRHMAHIFQFDAKCAGSGLWASG